MNSLVFNFFTYVGIAIACIASLPTLLLPRKKFLSKISYFLGYYLIFLTKYILGTQIEFVGMNKIPKDKKFFIADRILAKHDEKYMPPEIKKILENNAK